VLPTIDRHLLITLSVQPSVQCDGVETSRVARSVRDMTYSVSSVTFSFNTVVYLPQFFKYRRSPSVFRDNKPADTPSKLATTWRNSVGEPEGTKPGCRGCWNARVPER